MIFLKDKAYFYARRDKTNDSKFNLFFQFEADELVHSIDSTVRLSWMERWLEKFLKEKLMTRQILFLASEFESTRIDEERLKTLEKKIIPPEKIIVINTIEENMVEFDQVMAGWEDPTSEKENLDLMKTSVFTLFRSFDKEDLGMVSKEEFLDVSLDSTSSLGPSASSLPLRIRKASTITSSSTETVCWTSRR